MKKVVGIYACWPRGKEKDPCKKGRIPIFGTIDRNQPHPLCPSCAGPTALIDLGLNEAMNKLFKRL